MKKCLLLSIMAFKSFAVTLEGWKSYSAEQKINYMSDNLSDIDILLQSGTITHSRLNSARLEIAKTKIGDIYKNLTYFETNLNTEVYDDMYATVGNLQVSADLYFSEDNHFLGSQIQYFQSGCSHIDDSDEYIEGAGNYKDFEEAEKNNCHDNDVSWSGYSTTDQLFKELQHSDYMEWSGH